MEFILPPVSWGLVDRIAAYDDLFSFLISVCVPAATFPSGLRSGTSLNRLMLERTDSTRQLPVLREEKLFFL